MKTSFSPKNNPRVIIIQKLYGKFYNDDEQLTYPKHRFKKFIKDIVSGTIERNDIILEELEKNLGEKFSLNNLDKLFQFIWKAATYEFLYKPYLYMKVIVKEYVYASMYFIYDLQIKILNVILDIIVKKLISTYAEIWGNK